MKKTWPGIKEIINLMKTGQNVSQLHYEEKTAKVMPCHKSTSAKDVNNYQPISLLSTFSKIIEKLMANRLNNFLDIQSIIYPN